MATDDSMPVISPYDGQTVGLVPRCSPDHVEAAVAAARRTLHEGPLPAWQRAAILDRAANALRAEPTAERFARSIAEEAAKPIITARAEVERAVSTFEFAAATCRTLTGDVLALDASVAGEGRLGFTRRMPIGVVAAITPFNFPLNLVVHKLAPAIAAGCPVVLKPAHQTPLTGIMLAELLLDECGLPAGWLSVVTGHGSEVGAALAAHEDVAMITFTGSPQVGWGIRASAVRKKVSLELGNNAPVIVEPDANISAAASKIAIAGFSHAGQSCISVQRVFVHESIAPALIKELVSNVESLVVGDPMDERTQVSALIDTDNRDRVLAWIEEALDAGATRLTGGIVDESGVLLPTVLANVSPDMRVCAEEVFGPVVGVSTYATLQDAIDAANDTRYGLNAGIFTTDLAAARDAIDALDFGAVIVNDVPTWRADQMPYGGVRDSGNTREGPLYSVLEMTELRTAVFA